MTTAKLLYISASTLFYLSIPRLPRFTLFPYTTLFRSREAFGKVDALLERFLDFLVVQRVRRAVDQAAPIGDGRAAPRLEQTLALLGPRGAQRSGMHHEFVGDGTLLRVPGRLLTERLVAHEEFLDLHGVVGERLG